MESYMKGKLVIIDRGTVDGDEVQYLEGVGQIVGYDGYDSKDPHVRMVNVKVLHVTALTWNRVEESNKYVLDLTHTIKANDVIAFKATDLQVKILGTWGWFDRWLDHFWDDMEVGKYNWDDRPLLARLGLWLQGILYDFPFGDDPY